MRIIDKNNDFYDYLQDSTDTIVFDRRGSYELTKDRICSTLDMIRYYRASKYRFLLLQCGATYWLILATITDRIGLYNPSTCTFELLKTWKNYDKRRHIIQLDLVTFNNMYLLRPKDFSAKGFDYDKIKSFVDIMQQDIDLNNYTCEYTIANKLPLLKSSGFPTIINPMDIFMAIEEHFSMQKTESERTEAIGSTNSDKITMHGFDTKTSFRGKV